MLYDLENKQGLKLKTFPQYPIFTLAAFSLFSSLFFTHVEIPFCFRFVKNYQYYRITNNPRLFGIIDYYTKYFEEFVLNSSLIRSMFLFDFLFLFPFLFIPGCIFLLFSKKNKHLRTPSGIATFLTAYLYSFLFILKLYSQFKLLIPGKFFVFSFSFSFLFLFLFSISICYFSFKYFLKKNIFPWFVVSNLLINIWYFPVSKEKLINFTVSYVVLFLILLFCSIISKYLKPEWFLYCSVFLLLPIFFEWYTIFRWNDNSIAPYQSTKQLPAVTPTFTKTPNVILIVLDTFRTDYLDLSPNGITPSLAAFAAESVVYENCISTSSWTLPAHASIFTGLYPTTHGAYYLASTRRLFEKYKDTRINLKEAYYPLASENLTMAEILYKNGYRTYAVTANFIFTNRATGMAQGFESYDDRANPELYTHSFQNDLLFLPAISNVTRKLSGLTRLYECLLQYKYKRYRIAESINMSVKKRLEENSAKPLFLFINYMDVHEPRIPKKKYREKYGSKLREEWFKRLKVYIPGWYDFMEKKRKLTKEEKTHILTSYQGEVEYLDSQIGQLFKFLKESNLYENSIIIITADHGEQLGEHNIIGHGSGLYNESISVPLMIKYPTDKVYKKPSKHIGRISERVQLLDVLPTLLKFLGIKIPVFLEGYPVDDIESWDQSLKNRNIVSEQREKPFLVRVFGASFAGISRSIFHFPYKYIWDSRQEEKLFDLDVDYKEERNLLNEKKNIVEEMRKKLKEWVAQRKGVVKKAKARKLDKEEIEKLKNLGYL